MRQTELLELTMRMKPGQCVTLDSGAIREAAGDDLPALDRPARDEDVHRFVRSITSNWDVGVSYEPMRETYTLHKLPPNAGGNPRE